MSTKRTYTSPAREKRAAETKRRIVEAAGKLFESEGYEHATIEQIAQMAGVSAPTIYAQFQSKRGILRVLMDEALPPEQFQALVEQSKQAKTAEERLRIAAKIGRQLYDAEKALLPSASFLAPEFKELEKEREMRRHKRLEMPIKALVKEKALQKGLTRRKAKDILWAFTGRDLYRMLVIEQKWSSDAYEKWVGQMLIKSLL